MVSERVQRQIDRFLDEAEAAMAQSDWAILLFRLKASIATATDCAGRGIIESNYRY